MSGDDRTPEDRRDESTDEHDRHWLSSLLSALDWLGEASTSGRRRGDRTMIDYDVSIRTGEALDDRTRIDRSPLADDGADGDRDRDWNRPRTRRFRSDSAGSASSTPPSNDHHVTTRELADELLVTADVAGADPDDVTVGFDDATLVVAVSGRDLERIDVPWRERTADAAIKNGVLTVRIEPVSGEDGATDGEPQAETEGDDE